MRRPDRTVKEQVWLWGWRRRFEWLVVESSAEPVGLGQVVLSAIRLVWFVSQFVLSASQFAAELLEPFVGSRPLAAQPYCCLLYTSPSPRDRTRSRMPSSA